VPGDLLKHGFLDLTLVAFCAGQEAENELTEAGDHLKHRAVEVI